MVDLKNYASETAEPEASIMMETFRSIGYNIETAVADIIDNSITAQAKNVWIEFQWIEKNSVIIITDDGVGMNKDDLIEALRPGSINPLSERDPKDLGRFGLGLKTASLSQCRVLTVASKTEHDSIKYRAWNLDYVRQSGKWQLIDYISDADFLKKLNEHPMGTAVIWEDLDRLVKTYYKDEKSALEFFNKSAISVKNHLAMVFHRYVENGLIKLWLNDREIAPWDPFMRGEATTQTLTEESVLDGKVTIKPYILPHHTKLTEEKFESGSGINGWNAHQGYYIYRNQRLLLAGDWLGMFKKDEHCKLCRILLDLPNNLDSVWQIDIKKSVASPPSNLRKNLHRIGKYSRGVAEKIYRHRGKILRRQSGDMEAQMVWFEKIRRGKRFYQINRDHPVIKSFIDSSLDKKDTLRILQLIEETIPVPLIAMRASEDPEKHGKPYENVDHSEIIKIIQLMYNSMLASGKEPREAKSIIINIEPFDDFPQYIETLSGE